MMFADLGYWLPIKDGDQRAAALYARHYSSYQYADRRRQLHGYRNRFLIMGPGEKLLLLGNDERALFGWRRYHDASQGYGVSCTVFRNEGEQRSSDLIREAAALAWARWPGERLYTYINPKAIRSTNPGYCFKAAGWAQCGTTKGGLIILDINPAITLPIEVAA